jgi:hypothetical protein
MATTLNTHGYDSPIVYKDKAMTSTPTLIYGGACELYGWRITNPNSITVYAKFFDASAANQVTLGTTEPVKEFMIPAGGEVMAGNIMRISHYYFRQGMVLSFVNGLATSSTSAPTLSIDVEIFYRDSK